MLIQGVARAHPSSFPPAVCGLPRRRAQRQRSSSAGHSRTVRGDAGRRSWSLRRYGLLDRLDNAGLHLHTLGSDTFTVPEGVSSVEAIVVGGQGGHYFLAGDTAHGGSPAGDIIGRSGGSGGQAAGTLTGLTSGQVLQVDVAGKGVNGTGASRSGGRNNGPSGAGRAGRCRRLHWRHDVSLCRTAWSTNPRLSIR